MNINNVSVYIFQQTEIKDKVLLVLQTAMTMQWTYLWQFVLVYPVDYAVYRCKQRHSQKTSVLAGSEKTFLELPVHIADWILYIIFIEISTSHNDLHH